QLRNQPEITSFERQEVSNPTSQPSGSAGEPALNQPTTTPSVNGDPTAAERAPVPSVPSRPGRGTSEGSTAVAPIAVVAAPTPADMSAPTQQNTSSPSRQAAGGAGPKSDPGPGAANPAARPSNGPDGGRSNNGNAETHTPPFVDTPAIAGPGVGSGSGSDPSSQSGRVGTSKDIVMQGGSAGSRASMAWTAIATVLMIAAGEHILVGGRH
ncbi:hypothetical protein Vafri_10824, partial [Volvox africanus]